MKKTQEEKAMEVSSQELLMKRMQETTNKTEYKKLQTVKLYFIDDKRAEEVAKIMDTSVKMVYYIAGKYKKFGLSGLINKKRGGRKWAYMTLEEEKELLESMREEASKGMFVIVKLIKVKAEEKLGYPVSHDYVQDLLNRHGWRKLMPRPKHPKSSKEEQEHFKKKAPEYIQDAIDAFDPNDKRPVKIWTQDESRYGRMNNPRKCWAPAGCRPIVHLQRIREYIYVFSATNPFTGEVFSLILPLCNTDAMVTFLNELSAHYSDYKNVVFVDGAPWHTTDNIPYYDNIRFVFLPTGSPELNPTEHLWEHIREKYLGNKIFDSLDDLEKEIVDILVKITKEPNVIQKLTGFQWLVKNTNVC